MATIRNPTPFSLFSHVLMRSLDAGEVLDGLTDEKAREACSSGVFELGVLVSQDADDDPDDDDDDDKPVKRGPGRPRSVRGAVEVEEVTDEERETR